MPGPGAGPQTADRVWGRGPEPGREDRAHPGGGARAERRRRPALRHREVGPGQRAVPPGHALLRLPPVETSQDKRKILNASIIFKKTIQ